MTVRWALIKKQVREVLEDSGVEKSPVPIEDVAKKLGVQIRYQPLESELSGMVHLREDGTAIIGINSLHSAVRQRFSIAHEIGHYLLHSKESLHVDDSRLSVFGFRDEHSSQGIDAREIEANQFAAELLMPEDFLIEDVKKHRKGRDPESLIEYLANLYEVSIQAMTIKLTKLGIIA